MRKQHLEDLLRNQTEDFARIWLSIADQWYQPKFARPLPSTTYHDHWLLGKKGDISVYEFDHTEVPQEHFGPGIPACLVST